MEELAPEIILQIINTLNIRDIRALRCTTRYMNCVLNCQAVRLLLVKYFRTSYETPHPDNDILAAVKSHDIESVYLYRDIGGINKNLLRAAAITNDLSLFQHIERLYPPNEMAPIIMPAIRHDCRSIVNYMIQKYSIDYSLCLPTTAFCDNLTLAKLFESLGATSWNITLVLAITLGNHTLATYSRERLSLDTSNMVNIKFW
jgi:hypothetical protein